MIGEHMSMSAVSARIPRIESLTQPRMRALIKVNTGFSSYSYVREAFSS
jgi:hypothetical protein